jgi:hypothetical protein
MERSRRILLQAGDRIQLDFAGDGGTRSYSYGALGSSAPDRLLANPIVLPNPKVSCAGSRAIALSTTVSRSRGTAGLSLRGAGRLGLAELSREQAAGHDNRGDFLSSVGWAVRGVVLGPCLCSAGLSQAAQLIQDHVQAPG